MAGLQRADGGGLPEQTLDQQSPMHQQQISRYQGMTPEQLQEEALKLKGSPQGQMAQRVLQQKRIMPAPAQDPQAGLPEPYALGGSLQMHGGVHMGERGISAGATGATPAGFLHTAGPGRSDNLNIHPHADSYVIPADVVSGVGEGNSLAGARALQDTFKGATSMKSGPYGVPMPSPGHIGHRMGPPKAPRPGNPSAGGFSQGMPRAKGGPAAEPAEDEPEPVPIVAAGGEFVIPPEQVKLIGGGDVKRGLKILDAFVLHARNTTIKEMRGLKGPVKS